MATSSMKAKTSHWSANRARLFRADGTRLCEVKLSHYRDDGTLQIGDKSVLQARNERGDRSWCLLQDTRELLYAFLMPGDAPCIIIEKKGEDTGTVIERLRIRRDPAGYIYQVHRYATEVNYPAKTQTTKIDEESMLQGTASETTASVVQVTDVFQTTSVDGVDVEIRPTDGKEKEGDEDLELADCPSGRVYASSDFPTPVSYMNQPREEAKLCAVFTAYHPRKYRVELMEKLDDEMLSFLFFFFRIIERKHPTQLQKNTTAVLLADEGMM